MRQSIVNFANKVYLNTPYQSLRSIYYRAFCAMVRNRIVQASIDGINYELNLGETIDVGIYLNRYELDVSRAIKKICRPGFTVLDIGANIGAHTLHLAKIAGESGKVYAFEPTDYAYQKLVRNICLNRFNNINPIQVVLSDKSCLRQSIHFKSSWPTKGNPVNRNSIVDFVKLDDWCKCENIEHVDLIKLDVDGNEYSVIMGAESLLTSQYPVIIMEVWGPNFLNDLKNPFVVLKDFGYKFYHISTGEEYINVGELRDGVSLDGNLLDIAFNIVAKC
jgi:FkbM family methyltransferase